MSHEEANNNFTIYTDFTILKMPERKEVYLEHFGISEDGKNDRYTDEELEKYKKAIRDKIKIHKSHGTNLIYTYSKYNDGRSLIEHLSEILKANDIPKIYIDAAYYTKEEMIEYYEVLYNNGMEWLFEQDINPQNKESMDKLWDTDGKERQKNYDRFIKNYVEKLGNCKYVNIPGDHYIYEYKPDEVEQEMRSFLETL